MATSRKKKSADPYELPMSIERRTLLERAEMATGAGERAKLLQEAALLEATEVALAGRGARSASEALSLARGMGEVRKELEENASELPPVNFVITGQVPKTLVKCPACTAAIWILEGAQVIFDKACPECAKPLHINLAKANSQRESDRQEAVTVIPAAN